MADGLHYKPPEEESSDSGDDVSPDFKSAIARAFPDDDWDDDRLRALKEAIGIYYDEAEAKEDMSDDDEPDEKSPSHSTLALLFGKPKGK